MNEITLKLSLEEVNAILNALGSQPFAQVHQLVARVQEQGSSQLKDGQTVQAPKEEEKSDTPGKK